MSDDSLRDTVAAVTGASSGIGEATALALARRGASVALGARRADRLVDLSQRIEAEGGRALAVTCDVSNEEEAAEFIGRTNDELGRVDFLVNNAGVMLLGPVEGANTDDWRRMIDANIYGVLYCTHAAIPIMRSQGGGHIINVSSVAGRTAGPGRAVYNLTKFGVTGFSEALRQEVLDAGIRVTSIEPGFVRTELQGHNTAPGAREQLEQLQNNIGEVLESEDIADAIVYALCQPRRVALNELLVRPLGQR